MFPVVSTQMLTQQEHAVCLADATPEQWPQEQAPGQRHFSVGQEHNALSSEEQLHPFSHWHCFGHEHFETFSAGSEQPQDDSFFGVEQPQAILYLCVLFVVCKLLFEETSSETNFRSTACLFSCSSQKGSWHSFYRPPPRSSWPLRGPSL